MREDLQITMSSTFPFIFQKHMLPCRERIELDLIELTCLHLYGIESVVNLGVRALGMDCLAAGGSSNIQFFLRKTINIKLFCDDNLWLYIIMNGYHV